MFVKKKIKSTLGSMLVIHDFWTTNEHSFQVSNNLKFDRCVEMLGESRTRNTIAIRLYTAESIIIVRFFIINQLTITALSGLR